MEETETGPIEEEQTYEQAEDIEQGKAVENSEPEFQEAATETVDVDQPQPDEQETEEQETLYVQQVGDDADADGTTHYIHIIQDAYQDVDGEPVFVADEDDDEGEDEEIIIEEDEDDDDDDETQEQQVTLLGGKVVQIVPKRKAVSENGRLSKKHCCGEANCEAAFRSKKSLLQHLTGEHSVKLATFKRQYDSITHMLWEFERIQRSGNYMFGSDYKTFNSSTKVLRVIYVCAHDRKLRKNRQAGQVCTAHIEFVVDYNTGCGSLSGCLEHYKHIGYRNLSEFQFSDTLREDFTLTCPICSDTFETEAAMLQHAFEKLHHIAPRFIRVSKKKDILQNAEWESEASSAQLRCDLCDFETNDRSYYMTHRVRSHLSTDCTEKCVAKTREEANATFRQAQTALNARFFLANKRVNDSSIISYSFRCNFNRRNPTSVCVCSFKMLEFPTKDRYEIEIIKVHDHDNSPVCEEDLDDLPPCPDLFACQTCDRVFQNDAILRDHMRANQHYTEEDLEAIKSETVTPKQFFCTVCSVGFTKKLSLRQHQKNFNHDYQPCRIKGPLTSFDTNENYKQEVSDFAANTREKKVIQLFPNLCYDCNHTLPNKIELLRHLGDEHGYEVDLFNKEFNNMDQVWRFFYEIQINTKTRYKQHGSQRVDEENFKIYYICNREGKDKTKKVNRQRLRKKPPKDVNRACTAHFTIRRDHGKILCSGSTTHYGHEIEEEFLMRGKILQKAMEIIQKVPDEVAQDVNSPILEASDFPYHSDRRVIPTKPTTVKEEHQDIQWTPPFSDTYTVSPIDGNSFYVGLPNKQARIVSHKSSTEDYCNICVSKPMMLKNGVCPHIYQCDCEFYQAGYHNCKHIIVAELYLNQGTSQDNVLYLNAPCSDEDLVVKKQACVIAQLGEDIVKILENLHDSYESTALLTSKMNMIRDLLKTTDKSDAEQQTEESMFRLTEETSEPQPTIVEVRNVRPPTQRTILLQAPLYHEAPQIITKMSPVGKTAVIKSPLVVKAPSTGTRFVMRKANQIIVPPIQAKKPAEVTVVRIPPPEPAVIQIAPPTESTEPRPETPKIQPVEMTVEDVATSTVTVVRDELSEESKQRGKPKAKEIPKANRAAAKKDQDGNNASAVGQPGVKRKQAPEEEVQDKRSSGRTKRPSRRFNY